MITNFCFLFNNDILYCISDFYNDISDIYSTIFHWSCIIIYIIFKVKRWEFSRFMLWYFHLTPLWAPEFFKENKIEGEPRLQTGIPDLIFLVKLIIRNICDLLNWEWMQISSFYYFIKKKPLLNTAEIWLNTTDT